MPWRSAISIQPVTYGDVKPSPPKSDKPNASIEIADCRITFAMSSISKTS